MKCLALDLATPKASLALVENDRLVTEIPFTSDKNHSSSLFSLLEPLAPVFPSLDCWAINLGPGSFTGIRAAIAALKGLNYPFQKPVYGVNAHDAICAELLESAPLDESISQLCLVSDARRGEAYITSYQRNGQKWTPRSPTRITAINALPAQFVHGKGRIFFTGSDITVFAAQINQSFGRHAQIAPEPLYSTARHVAQIAADMHAGKIPACTALEPVYLRPVSYAKLADKVSSCEFL